MSSARDVAERAEWSRLWADYDAAVDALLAHTERRIAARRTGPMTSEQLVSHVDHHLTTRLLKRLAAFRDRTAHRPHLRAVQGGNQW